MTLQRRVHERLDDELVAAYQRDGAVCIRQLLDRGELALLRDGIEANLAQPSPRAKVASRPDDPGRFFEDFCNWQDIPQFKRFIFESPLALVAQRLMPSNTVRLYHDHLLVKEPGTRQRTPWHQDQPYYNIEGRQNISMWIPVDPVSRTATLEFIAGSHRGPWLMPRTFMDHQAKWFPEGSLADLHDIEAARADHPIIGWAAAYAHPPNLSGSPHLKRPDSSSDAHTPACFASSRLIGSHCASATAYQRVSPVDEKE